MIIALLIIIVALLSYINYQIFDNWTKPNIENARKKTDAILKVYDEILKEKYNKKPL
jgi:hypothetical protein